MAISYENKHIRRRTGTAAVLTTLALLAWGRGELNDVRANQAQPACDVTATNGSMISGIRSQLGNAGDSGDHVQVFAYEDGHLRNPDNPEDAPRFFVNGSMNLQPGDTVRVMHVNPQACQRIGGTVMPLAAIEASMRY